MAVELTLHESLLPHDESAEEALERAALAWQTARARFDTVDPSQLSPAGREAYYRLLVKIGLWADARVSAGSDDEGAVDAAKPVTHLAEPEGTNA